MLKTIFPPALLLGAAVLAAPALASSSDWYEAEGGRVRLVTTGAADENGVIEGVLRDRPQARLEDLLARSGRCRRAADARRVGKQQHRVRRAVVPGAAALRRRLCDLGRLQGAGRLSRRLHARRRQAAGDDRGRRCSSASARRSACRCRRRSRSIPPAIPTMPTTPRSSRRRSTRCPGPNSRISASTLAQGRQGRSAGRGGFCRRAGVGRLLPGGRATAISSARPSGAIDGERLLFSVPILERPEQPPAEGALHYTLVTGAGAVSGMLPYPAQ